jgi:hypothetical protein
MDELIRELTALGQGLEFPPTPELARAVGERLSAPAAVAAHRRRWRLPAQRTYRALAAAGLTMLALAATALAFPGIRDKVLDLLGVRGATIERTSLPAPSPSRRPLELGERVSLAEAPMRIAFPPLVPASIEPPAAVHVDSTIPGGALSLSYRPRPGLPRAETTGLGLLVTEFRGDINPEYLTKVVPKATTVRRLRIDDTRAAWIAGAPHYFFYRSPGQGFREAPLQIAQNVLLVERGHLLIRLEGAFSLPRARAIAGSLRSLGTRRAPGL